VDNQASECDGISNGREFGIAIRYLCKSALQAHDVAPLLASLVCQPYDLSDVSGNTKSIDMGNLRFGSSRKRFVSAAITIVSAADEIAHVHGAIEELFTRTTAHSGWLHRTPPFQGGA
jgi:hypothetical protein